MDEDNSGRVLIDDKRHKYLPVQSDQIITFENAVELVDWVFKNFKNQDSLNIFIDGGHFDRLQEKVVFGIRQVKRIILYFNSLAQLELFKLQHDRLPSKIDYCLKNEIVGRIRSILIGSWIQSSSNFNQPMIKSFFTEKIEALSKIRQSLLTNHMGFDVANLDNIEPKFICSVCKLILREPVQLTECGHRTCKSCAENLINDTVICPIYNEETSKQNVMVDKGMKREMKTLPIKCLYCNWKGLLNDYENHLHLFHDDLTPCDLKEYGCSRMMDSSFLQDHYLSLCHQQALMNFIRAHQTRASLDKAKQSNKELACHWEAENQSVEQAELALNQSELSSTLMQDASSLVEVEDNIGFNEIQLELYAIRRGWSNSEPNCFCEPISYDGTLTWRISNISEKLVDVKPERQSSIYSPMFYSSPTGYKMRARLYTNEDGHDRRTRISLFFVLARGEYDSLLTWPFKYKVSFCLYDQSAAQGHIIDSFRPDPGSVSFQRPCTDMNIASGIPNFCSLSCLQDPNSPYVKDDTMFIGVMVHFDPTSEDLAPDTFRLDPGIPMALKIQIIQKMKKATEREKKP